MKRNPKLDGVERCRGARTLRRGSGQRRKPSITNSRRGLFRTRHLISVLNKVLFTTLLKYTNLQDSGLDVSACARRAMSQTSEITDFFFLHRRSSHCAMSQTSEMTDFFFIGQRQRSGRERVLTARARVMASFLFFYFFYRAKTTERTRARANGTPCRRRRGSIRQRCR